MIGLAFPVLMVIAASLALISALGQRSLDKQIRKDREELRKSREDFEKSRKRAL